MLLKGSYCNYQNASKEADWCSCKPTGFLCKVNWSSSAQIWQRGSQSCSLCLYWKISGCIFNFQMPSSFQIPLGIISCLSCSHLEAKQINSVELCKMETQLSSCRYTFDCKWGFQHIRSSLYIFLHSLFISSQKCLTQGLARTRERHRF